MNCTCGDPSLSLSLSFSFFIHYDFRNWKSATSSLRNFCICSLGSRWRRRWRWRRLPAMTNVVANLARSCDNGMNVCCASNSVDVKSGVERDQQEREREREREVWWGRERKKDLTSASQDSCTTGERQSLSYFGSWTQVCVCARASISLSLSWYTHSHPTLSHAPTRFHALCA